MSEAEQPDYSSWVGRTETVADHVCPTMVERMRATLGYPVQALSPGDALPAAWHWMFCVPAVPAHGLGDDGHPARGGFLPPVELPRRMWVGGELRFAHPLPVDASLGRRSTIASVQSKSGRSGALCFVSVEHEYRADGAVVLTERQDIVYREAPPPGANAPSPPPPPEVQGDVSRRSAAFDTTTLFRYSALTFNGHRIHYDADYVRDVEGYPGLVVHGPLMATLLMQHVRVSLGTDLASISYRIASPVFAGETISLCASRGEDATVKAWVEKDGGLVLGAEGVIR